MRKGIGQVDNLFIISGYFLLLSRAESVCTIESKHEVDVVKEMQERPSAAQPLAVWQARNESMTMIHM